MEGAVLAANILGFGQKRTKGFVHMNSYEARFQFYPKSTANVSNLTFKK